jgi:hypothetical protein
MHLEKSPSLGTLKPENLCLYFYFFILKGYMDISSVPFVYCFLIDVSHTTTSDTSFNSKNLDSDHQLLYLKI